MALLILNKSVPAAQRRFTSASTPSKKKKNHLLSTFKKDGISIEDRKSLFQHVSKHYYSAKEAQKANINSEKTPSTRCLLTRPKLVVDAFKIAEHDLVEQADSKKPCKVSIQHDPYQKTKTLLPILPGFDEKVAEDLKCDLGYLIGGLLDVLPRHVFYPILQSNDYQNVKSSKPTIQAVIDEMSFDSEGFNAVLEEGRPSRNEKKLDDQGRHRSRKFGEAPPGQEELYSRHQQTGLDCMRGEAVGEEAENDEIIED